MSSNLSEIVSDNSQNDLNLLFLNRMDNFWEMVWSTLLSLLFYPNCLSLPISLMIFLSYLISLLLDLAISSLTDLYLVYSVYALSTLYCLSVYV